MTDSQLLVYDNEILSKISTLSYKPYIRFYPEVTLDGSIDIENSMTLYSEWVKRDDYILLKEKNTDDKFLAIQAPKRGNKSFMSRVYLSTHDIYEIINNNKDFKIFDEQSRYAITPVLWITLTWNPILCSRDRAWCSVGSDLNKFFSSIRQKYGSFSMIRVFESFNNGYPHVHMLLFFHNQNFLVHRTTTRKNNKIAYRCNDDVNDFFHSSWHSHVDLRGVYGFKPISYLLKYVTKTSHYIDSTIDNGKGVKTAMLCTWFQKRQFAISSDLPEQLQTLIGRRLDKDIHNSNIIEKKQYEIVGVLTVFNVNKRILRLDGLPHSTDCSRIKNFGIISIEKYSKENEL